MDAHPDVWFTAPEDFGVAGAPTSSTRWFLDPSMYEVWRETPDGPLWGRRRIRPEGNFHDR